MELGPEFWAVAVIVALILIEALELGPHSIYGLLKEKKSKAIITEGRGRKCLLKYCT